MAVASLLLGWFLASSCSGSGTPDSNDANPGSDAGDEIIVDAGTDSAIAVTDAATGPDLPICPKSSSPYVGAMNPEATSFATFLAFTGDLEFASPPDVLSIVIPYSSASAHTGTFTLPDSDGWNTTIRINSDQNNSLSPISGTLEILSMDGEFTGRLSDAVYVDDVDSPTCKVILSLVSFNESIEAF